MPIEGRSMLCDACGYVAPASTFPVANESWYCPHCGADESALIEMEGETKMAEPTKLSTREVADKLNTDPRTLRRFLRSLEKGVGTGSRYGFEPQQVGNLKKQFNAWQKEREAQAAAKEPAESEAE
jgi:rubredoxin